LEHRFFDDTRTEFIPGTGILTRLSFFMTPLQHQILAASLRDGESVLIAAPCGLPRHAPAAATPKSSFWARLFGKKTPAGGVASGHTNADFFAITTKRVLVFSGSAEPKEWFLMLGMIQRFDVNPDGSGSIILDYELTADGERRLLGLINIADAENVYNRLRSAIDDAYNASPWSV